MFFQTTPRALALFSVSWLLTFNRVVALTIVLHLQPDGIIECSRLVALVAICLSIERLVAIYVAHIQHRTIQEVALYWSCAGWTLTVAIVVHSLAWAIFACMFASALNSILLIAIASTSDRYVQSVDRCCWISLAFAMLSLLYYPAMQVHWITTAFLMRSLCIVSTLLALVLSVMDPVLELLQVRLIFRRLGANVAFTVWKGPLSEYAATSHCDSPDGVIVQAQAIVKLQSAPNLFGLSISVGTDKSQSVMSMADLNIAACELYERYVVRYNTSENRFTMSNGVAIHTRYEQAVNNSTRELIERDSVLAHYYTERPAVCKCDFKHLSYLGSQNESIAGASLIAKCFESTLFYRLFSPIDGILVFGCILRLAGVWSSGWATGSTEDVTGPIRAMCEALAGYRFLSSAVLSKVTASVSIEDIVHSQLNDFTRIADTCEISTGALQCACVYLSDPQAKTLEFLNNCPTVENLAGLLTYNQFEWYRAPHITSIKLRQPFKTSFSVVRAISEECFDLEWPTPSIETITRVLWLKGIPIEDIRETALQPCVVN